MNSPILSVSICSRSDSIASSVVGATNSTADIPADYTNSTKTANGIKAASAWEKEF